MKSRGGTNFNPEMSNIDIWGKVIGSKYVFREHMIFVSFTGLDNRTFVSDQYC